MLDFTSKERYKETAFSALNYLEKNVFNGETLKEIKFYLFGHSHIGDFVWGEENPFRKISWIKGNDIPQINVSSLEKGRGSGIRSVILEIYRDDTIGLFFRDHGQKKYTEYFTL